MSRQPAPEANSSALDGAPTDNGPHAGTAGVAVHPRAPQQVFDRPAGTAFTLIRPTQPWGQTWLPVIDQRPGWLRVLLPSGEDRETGWLDAARVSYAHSRHEIRVNLSAARLRLMHDGHTVGSWPISLRSTRLRVGSGRTFVLATVRRTPHSVPLLLRLALHAGDGYRGRITIHRQPAPGHTERASHGCIRVPDAAMTALGDVLPGCLVRIYSGSPRFRKALRP